MPLVMENIAVRNEGKDLLTGINLSLEEGTLHGLLCPAGSDRTTLLKVLSGLQTPCGGRLLFNGENITGKSPRKRNVAIVYQEFINYPNLNVFDNIASPLKRKKSYSKRDIKKRVEELASLFGLTDYLKRPPGELSGGQQQRCAFARALGKEADLLLLDDPLVNLDYKLREQLREELKEILKKGSSTVVYATADPREALGLGGKIIALHKGRVLQHEKATLVYEKPAHVEVAKMMSEPPLNLFKGDISDGKISFHGLRCSLPNHLKGLGPGRYLIGQRPHHFQQEEREGEGFLEGKVTYNEYNGLETFTHLETLEGQEFLFHQKETIHCSKEDILYLRPDLDRLYIFGLAGDLVKAPFFGD
ncbi:MAG: ABC transporter ATP-binding protein [Bdellovibrionota bacterium]|nr:ABC transporter ATP-binding protein [Bdellovibrionota bacterium]